MLDVLAPSNFAASNPEVLQKAFQSGGQNFVAAANLSYNLDVFVPDEDVGKCLAQERLILGNEHANHCWIGTSTVSLNPPPARSSVESRPPRGSIRSPPSKTA